MRIPYVLMLPSSSLSTKAKGVQASVTPLSTTPFRKPILLSHMCGVPSVSPAADVQLPQKLVNLCRLLMENTSSSRKTAETPPRSPSTTL